MHRLNLMSQISYLTSKLIKFQHRHKRRLRYLHVAYLAHAFLTFLLLIEQLAFTRNITAVTFGRHVLTQGLHRFTGDDLGADGCQYDDLELLTRQQLFQLLANLFTKNISIAAMDQ